MKDALESRFPGGQSCSLFRTRGWGRIQPRCPLGQCLGTDWLLRKEADEPAGDRIINS